MNRLRSTAVPHWAAARQASADLFGFLEERLAGTERHPRQRRHRVRHDALPRAFAPTAAPRASGGVVGTLGFNTAAVLLRVGAAVSLGVGGYLFLDGRISLG